MFMHLLFFCINIIKYIKYTEDAIKYTKMLTNKQTNK